MTLTRRGSARRLRSVLLVAALLSPAILASGMLMADFTGYGERARAQLSGSAAVRAAPARAADQKRAETTAETGGDRAPAGTPAARPAMPPTVDGREAQRIHVITMAGTRPLLNPTPVPAPPGPARLYEGVVRILPIARPVQRIIHTATTPKASRPTEEPEPHEEETFTCEPEWRDTWLWELCREHESQPEGGR
ncbi:hypothetical protein OHB01_05720 [Microbispora hainanensis]|uniref:hypothetical protein n=1 Tax=Microbispora hainanensis TaxID=568844 RepID=UPI002E28AF6F|nr:hypothetical protein [Microbispora hainanensis]